MGYMHIENLYRNQTILMFRECYALEKIHGTSAHVAWRNGRIDYSAGGEKHDRFVGLFDEASLREAFLALGHELVVVYGEAYGGKQQGQAWRYGADLRFVAFEVKIGDAWLSVPNAEDVAKKLGLEFVHYERVSTDLGVLNAQRDAYSMQARRNCVGEDKPREGVVLRPLAEFFASSGERVIAKHKRDEERETKTPRRVVDPKDQAVLESANAIAEEWVTPTRLAHVLDKFPQGLGIEGMRQVLDAMVEDVLREGRGEIVDSKPARAAICRSAARLFKQRLSESLK
jgi:hypothetical protein